MKRLYSVLIVCTAMAGMLFSIMQTEAADIGKIRGRVNVDLETFVCVEKTNKDSGMKSKNSKNTEYELWFSNSFTDRNNIGVTYRSGSSYDMTDVNEMETYMCSQQTSADKFLFYIDSNPGKYYHRMDRDKITRSIFGGNGTYWYFDNLAVEISNHIYSSNYRPRSTTLKAQYGNFYVFLGIAHEWQWHNAKLTFDNETRSGDFQGGLTLILKKHNITLLQPDYPKQVLEDGTQKEYVAFSNLKMRLEDGKSYEPGKAGDIYRDERVTVQYTLADAGNCSLKGYNFYSDKDRKNLLYTKRIEGGETESSFTLDSALIQNLEKGKSIRSLGNIYVEPIFEQRKVEVEISQIVPESTQSESGNHVQVSPVVTDGSQKYDSFRLEAVGADGKTEVIGSFQKNKAMNIGDVITFDYTPNPNYNGEFQFSHYEYRMCESRNQVSGTNPVEALYSSDKYDISQKLDRTYFWMQIHVMLKAEIVLTEKTVTYNNRSVTIDPAEVTYPEGYPAPTGTITYTYYKMTGEQYGQEEKLDAPPIDAGKYFVIAAMRQDAHYVSAESEPIPLTIEKAVPVLSGVRGEPLTYGQPLSASSESKISGTAEGVSKAKIVGTYTWVDGTQMLNVGINKVDVEFTPDKNYANNYDAARGKATVSVGAAAPTIVKGADKEAVYSGEPVVMEGAYAAGIDKKPTGQKITYDYYSSEKCDQASKLSGPPTDRGTYYVLAGASAQGNYGYAKAAADNASRITIHPRPAELLQVPVSALAGTEGREYRVYVSNVAGEKPKGTIQLSWTNGSVNIGQIREEENTGRYYASAVYGENGMISAGETVEIEASYISEKNDAGEEIDNYTIAPSKLDVDTRTGVIEEDVDGLKYGGGPCEVKVIDTLNRLGVTTENADIEVKMYTSDRSDDVAEITFSENNQVITVKPQNAGLASTTVYVTVNNGNAQTASSIPEVSEEQDGQDVPEVQQTADSLNVSEEQSTADIRDMPDVSDDSSVPDDSNVPDKQNMTEGQNELEESDASIEQNPADVLDISDEQMESETLNAFNVQNTIENSVIHYYITYRCPVEKAEQKSYADNKESLIYNTLPQTYPVKRAENVGEVKAEEDITDLSRIQYVGTSYLGEEYEKEVPPADAGEYTMKVTVPETRNLKEYVFESEMIIGQAEPVITAADKTITYNGHPQTLEPAVLNGISNDEIGVTGAVSWQYTCTDGVNKDQVSSDAPIHAGKYTVEAAVAADGNYKGAKTAEPARLTIEQAKCTVKMQNKQAVYTGEPIYLNPPVITGVENETVTANIRIDYRHSAILGRSGEQSENESAGRFGFIDHPTDAGIYYGWAVKSGEGDYKAAMSDRTILVIRKAEVSITVPKQTAVYSGETPRIEGTSIAAENGKNLPAESEQYLRYHYFSDEAATEEIDPPVDAGVYYVQAWIAEQDNYKAARSNVQKLTIEKAIPALSDVSVSNITYGEMGNAAQAAGKAAGVKGEELNGAFQPEGEICTEKPDAGSYEMSVRFTPDAETARNYQSATAAALLNVLPARPEIVGSDKTKVYDGRPAALEEVRLEGVPDMPAPAGVIQYEYFMDRFCTQPVPDSNAGVTDAGTYYCKVTVVTDTANYQDTSAVYSVTVEKAPAVIGLRVFAVGKDQVNNIVTIYGKLPGVFDDPTGSINILIRESAGEDQNAEDEYRIAAENINITEVNGIYGFTADVNVGADGIYDFKAEYVEGGKQNYTVYPGELMGIDMSRQPQHIDFEAHLMRMIYGSDAFIIQADESEAPGSGEITYRLMENISQPGVVSVSPEGTVEILNVGTAFVMAVKQGDELYNGTMAVVCIQVTKAPVTLSLEDKTVMYDGNPQEIQAVLTSQEKAVKEELPVVYVYVDQESGQMLKEEPACTGTYVVSAYVPETEHYLRAAGRGILTIKQVDAAIKLSVYEKDVNDQTVTLVGQLPEVFDWPNGAITIYMRIHGTEEYTAEAEDILIMESNGEWGFFEVLSVPAGYIYDFKAVFVGNAGQNYRILDGAAENVDMRKPESPDSPDSPPDDPGTDDPGTDNPSGSDPGANDPNQPSDGSGANDPNKPYFDDLNTDQSNGTAGGKAAPTGDPVSDWPVLLFTAAGVVLVITGRKTMRNISRND